MDFTICQENAIYKIEEFLLDKEENIMIIEGSAGTGKSYVITAFQKKRKDLKFIYTAPTHKAVKILRDMTAKNDCRTAENYCMTAENGCMTAENDCMTLHKFFNLNLEYNDDGSQYLVSKGAKFQKNIILVIDEISMISEEIYNIIIEQNKNLKIKIICLGDRCQLPPIYKIDTIDNEEDDEEEKLGSLTIETLSPFFIDKKYMSMLKKVKRTNNKDLKNLYAIFKQYTLDENTNNFKSKLLEFKLLNISSNIRIETCKNHFTEQINKYIEKEKAYIICSRNKTVKEYVKKIKDRLYPNSQYPFNQGENIYITKYFQFDNSISCDCKYGDKPSKFCNQNVFYTSQEYIIKSSKKINLHSDYFDASYDCYEYEINYKLHNDEFLKIRTICDSSIVLFKKKLLIKQNEIKKLLIEKQNRIKKLSRDDKEYAIKKLLIEKEYKVPSMMWRDFNYHKNYFQSPFTSSLAITAYKSQGSTYNYVFVDGSDIEQCRRTTFLKTKELYTAVTRTSKYICIFLELENKYTEIPSNILKCTRCHCWRKHDQFKLNKKNIFVKTCLICSEKALIKRNAELTSRLTEL